MCGGQLSLILYLSLEEDKRDCGSFACIMIILDWMWQESTIGEEMCM
jgi:hypothetical protein